MASSVTERPVRLSLIRPKYTRSILPLPAAAKNSSPLAPAVPVSARRNPRIAAERTAGFRLMTSLANILHEPALFVDENPNHRQQRHDPRPAGSQACGQAAGHG